LNKIFAIVIQQYNLMVCVALSLIGCDPKVSHLLAESPNAIAVHLKGLWQWGGGLKNDLVDYSARKEFPLTC